MTKKNGSTNNGNGNGHTPVLNMGDPIWKDIRDMGLPVPDELPNFTTNQLEELKDVVFNLTTLRANFIQQLLDPRRDYDAECGYKKPSEMNPRAYKDMYERFGIATRVVNVLPDESWMINPEIYETEDGDDETEFEKAVDNLAIMLRGGSKFQDEKGSPLWEYLHRADCLSGIGTFGCILFGFNDGLPLWQPIKGVPPDGQALDNPNLTEKPNIRKDDVKHPIITPPGTEMQYGPQSRYSPQDEHEDYKTNPPKGTGQTQQGTKKNGVGGKGKKGSVGGKGTATDATGGKGIELHYIRVFDEALVQVAQFENDPASRRYGLPMSYYITLNDFNSQRGGLGLPINTVQVHWSRVLHLADISVASSSEVYAIPRMSPVFDHLWDLKNKLYGGSAEMYWRGALPGWSLETHPQYGGDVKVNRTNVRAQMEQYQNGLQRYLVLMGMSAKSMAPQVVDPTPWIDATIQAICILIGIPVRIFMGSERGELASSQDDSTWNDRLAFRQNGYITPRIIVPFIDRLIMVGVLPDPTGYSVKWPDLNALTDTEKAAILLQRTQAFVAYMSGGVENLVPPHEYLTHEADYTDEEAEAILKSAEDHQQEFAPDAEDAVPGHTPTPAPEPGQPIQMGAGEHLISPDGKKVLQKTPHKPFPPKAPVKNLASEEYTQLTRQYVAHITTISDEQLAEENESIANDREQSWKLPLLHQELFNRGISFRN